MALDEDLHRADSDSLDVWAPIHASSTGNLPKPRYPLPRNAVAAKNPESPLLPSVESSHDPAQTQPNPLRPAGADCREAEPAHGRADGRRRAAHLDEKPLSPAWH